MSKIGDEAARAETIEVLGAVEVLAAQCADLRKTLSEAWGMVHRSAGPQQLVPPKSDALSEAEWHELAGATESELMASRRGRI